MNCGSELISPKDAELSMCTACLGLAITGAKKQIKGRKSRENVKRFKIKVNPRFVKFKE